MKPRRRIRVPLFFALCALGVLGWVFWPRERLLTNRATRVASIGDPEAEGWHGYSWISDRELFVVSTRVIRTGKHNYPLTTWFAYRQDIGTGRTTPLPALNAAMLREAFVP